jgi:hypothetical protein
MDQPMHDPGMEGRVDRLERDMADVKAALGRLEPMVASIFAQVPHLATRADLEVVRGELKVELAHKPGYGAMWSMGIALFALTAGAMSAGAFYLPLIYRVWHITP